jgi:hypothetical protein
MIDSKLVRLAELMEERNHIEQEVSEIISRPFLIGHIGEYIASNIFDIELNKSASAKGHDGFFKNGELCGKSVNIKYYSRREGLLDLNSESGADYYLVFVGKSKASITRPWNIESIFLFEENELFEKLTGKVKIGIATSVKKALWEDAIIYPNQKNMKILVSEEIREKLALFGWK